LTLRVRPATTAPRRGRARFLQQRPRTGIRGPLAGGALMSADTNTISTPPPSAPQQPEPAAAPQPQPPPAPPPSWAPLSPVERRVLGVLVEKQKTSKTADAYPLTLNALVTGCNQKSNRDPVLDLDEVEVEEALGALQKK